MKKRSPFTLTEVILFGLFPAIIFATQQATALFPNIHLTGMSIMLMTLLFRWKALVPLYVYIFLMGISLGFGLWWIPYLYVWIVLWGMTMLIPKTIPPKVAAFVYPAVCALHGFAYGSLWALSQPFLMGFDARGTLAWIINGLPFDLIHGISNLVTGLLVLPLYQGLKRFLRPSGKTK